MKILTPFFVILLICSTLVGQFYPQFDCNVSQEGRTLAFPFTGGFDAPQFTQIDLNYDGLEDIYVFDRNGNSSTFLINTGSNDFYPYRLDNSVGKNFPTSLEGFTTMADFDKDGLFDIFTAGTSEGVSGVMLLQAFEENEEIVYKARRMGRPSGQPNVIWNNLPSAQVYVATTDIPSIVDVDFDGDLDILTFDEAGSYVYFCKNSQVEKSLPSDTMDFQIADYCFGKFQESGLSQVINLSTNPTLCANGFQGEENESTNKSGGAHSGSTVRALDNDNDNDYDLLLGDLTYNGIVYLNNGGNKEAAHMTSKDDFFPSYDTPADMPVFLAAFNIDVDNDGLDDVLVSPNSLSSSQNTDNIWYYKNTANPNTQFELVQKDLFSEETLDFGSYSVPALLDYNADGLMDILVGSGGVFNGIENEMRLILLENTGTENIPEFIIADNDYLDFSEYRSTSSNPAPTTGDLDGDGDIDIIIGDEAGKLYFIENLAGQGNAADFGTPQYNYMGISAGQRIRPQLFDYNSDGLLDLIIGQRNTNTFNHPLTGDFVAGNLSYYQNQGTESEAFYNSDITASPNYPVLGNIKVSFSVSTSAKGGAHPYFFNIHDQKYAMVGSLNGRLSLYEINSDNPWDEALLLDDRLGKIQPGFYSANVAYDFNSDGVLEILSGNSRGGLNFHVSDIMLTSTSNSEIISNNEALIFPNPVRNSFSIQTTNTIESIQLYNIKGQRISEWKGYHSNYNVPQNINGIHILEIAFKNGSVRNEKLVIVD